MIDALKKQGYVSPSPIQERVIPKALKGQNVIAQSETGSGKTHAFLIPIIEKVDLSNDELQSIIISPTRELAKQTFDFAKRFVEFYPNLRISLYQGGNDRDREIKKSGNKMPHIAIGTPGRLADVLLKSGTLQGVKTIVFDEADMLLDFGFFADVDKIVDASNKAQILVFSATLKDNLKFKLSKYIGQNEEIISEATQTSSTVIHHAIDIKQMNIKEATKKFLDIVHPYSIIIFASKKEEVIDLFNYLRKEKYNAAVLHGDLSQRERKSMIRRFKAGEFQILVSSDIGARGIDVEDVSDVLNVDLTKDTDYYFHRAGRTGRFGKKGDCYTFYQPDSVYKILQLMDLGVNFIYHVFGEDELLTTKAPTRNKNFKKKVNVELEKQIHLAKAKATSKKVKPGYKKKVKIAIEKVKKEHRREVIKKDIRRQMTERYKKEGKDYDRE